MIRTQVRMDEREYAAAKAQAAKLGISFAELIRRALRTMLLAEREKPWMRCAGFVRSSNPRSSPSVDQIVYGRMD